MYPFVSLGAFWHLYLIRSLPKYLPSDSALTPNPGLATCREPLPATDLKTIMTQESNWDLLHCKWILYQLSYEGSPQKC